MSAAIAANVSLLARISNWLHGRSGESVLELAKDVEAALRAPEPEMPVEEPRQKPNDGEVICKLTVWKRKGDRYDLELVHSFHPRASLSWRGATPIGLPEGRTMIGFDFRGIIREKNGAVLAHEHEHAALTRGCELCLNIARALTPDERDECMLLLESIETIRCQHGGLAGCPNPASVSARNKAGGGMALCRQHFDAADPLWVGHEPLAQPARVLSVGDTIAARRRREASLQRASMYLRAEDAPTSPPAPSEQPTVVLHPLTSVEETLRAQLEEARSANAGLHITSATERREAQALKDKLERREREIESWKDALRSREREHDEVVKELAKRDEALRDLRVELNSLKLENGKLQERLRVSAVVFVYFGRALKSASEAQVLELNDLSLRARCAVEALRKP